MRAYDPGTQAWTLSYFLIDHLGSMVGTMDATELQTDYLGCFETNSTNFCTTPSRPQNNLQKLASFKIIIPHHTFDRA